MKGPCVPFGVIAGVFLALPRVSSAQAPPASGVSSTVVVSAGKMPEESVDVPGAASVVTGDELRRSGARTVADALQDVVGVDTANGSDNGPRLANIGLWGLKEFDALLVTVDGVPVGGPFNPSLAQIAIEDVDRIEIVKGPQGTLYGVSAFAGMVQVFTRRGSQAGGSVSLGGGSFSEKRASLFYARPFEGDLGLKLFGTIARSNGWQDRTDFSDTRLGATIDKRWGRTALGVTLTTFLDTSYFGSPLPVDAGEPVPGFILDRNYAVGGARLDHRVYALSSTLTTPIGKGLKLENTLGLTRDDQTQIRSFIGESGGGVASAAGVALTPREDTLFEDLRIVAEVGGRGRHRIVAGAAVTWGRTTAEGTGFDFDLTIGQAPVSPEVGSIPAGDHRSFSDRRTFLGIYANDEWTPIPSLTFGVGARYDSTSESLSVQMQEVGTPAPDVARDDRTDGQWSGGVSALYRFLEKPAGLLEAANVYVSLKSAFKPAAPNLSEAESARILDPERTRSAEAGIKTRWLKGAVSADLSFFHMDFENLVVSTLGSGGEPVLTNAGEERFQGVELDLRWQPAFLRGLSVSAGYAHHDATFVRFSFLTPDGELRVVDGKRLELVPRDLWNVRIGYAPERGPGGFIAFRHQGRRPLTRRNTFYTDGFEELDAGISWDCSFGRLVITGRNLGDNRHYVADSEIGDSQFYVAPPRRFLAEVTVKF